MVEPLPIFVTGFSRGGTTILMNLLASHPQVCTVGEIHQIFKGSSVRDSAGKVLLKSLLRDLPVILATRQDLFSPRCWQPRRPVGPQCRNFIRRVLRKAQRDSFHEHLNRFKSEGRAYQRHEVEQARMLGKNLDGMVFLTETFQEIYPPASFVGLLRNGLAVCEGHVRRGRSASSAGRMYRTVAEKMLRDAERIEDYQLVRFEDLLASPVRQLQRLYVGLGLSPFVVRQVRWQERRIIDEQGRHRLRGSREWDLRWLPLEDLPATLDTEVNQRQIRLLSPQDRDAFLQEAGPTMERLGYLGSAPDAAVRWAA